MNESSFKFLGYRISQINFRIEDGYGKAQENINQKINIENYFNQDNKKFVEVVLNITVKSDTNNFDFFLKIKGGFLASDDINDEDFQKLAQNNGPAILFPFARSIITSYTAQANIPPIILPTINFFVDKNKQKID
jgi:preprotein translocase subunit SecB